MTADKISLLPKYAKGRGKGMKSSPDIQKYWLPIHTKNFEAIKELIFQVIFIWNVTLVLNMSDQYFIKYKMGQNMSLHFIAQLCQMQHADTLARSWNYFV